LLLGICSRQLTADDVMMGKRLKITANRLIDAAQLTANRFLFPNNNNQTTVEFNLLRLVQCSHSSREQICDDHNDDDSRRDFHRKVGDYT